MQLSNKPNLAELWAWIIALEIWKSSQWTKSDIIPILKKVDLFDPANYRGISLACIGAKIYNRMILNRLQPHIDPMRSVGIEVVSGKIVQ